MSAFITVVHVPVKGVIDAFEELAATMPQHHGMDEFLTYFEHPDIHGRRLPGCGLHYSLRPHGTNAILQRKE